MREILSKLLRTYSRVLNKYKYTTQIVTGGFLWFSGDLLCQSLVHYGQRRNKNSHELTENGNGPLTIDWNRTGRMTLYGLVFSAPTYAVWYSSLERYAQRIFSAPPPGSAPQPTWLLPSNQPAILKPLLTPFNALMSSAARLRTWKMISFKLAMDTIVFDPLYLTLFFSATGAMEGHKWGEIREKLRMDLGRTWLIDVAVWTPIQTANFRFVPVLYQALVVQSCNVGWNAYLSYVQHDNAH